MKWNRLLNLFAGIAVLWLASCGKQSPNTDASVPHNVPPAKGASLTIVAGSENKSLEPIIQQFTRKSGVQVNLVYMGSVEIGQELAKGAQCPYDAIWPAASLWIDMFDTAKMVKNAESIMRTPVVFAVKTSVAQSLGWVGKEVKVMDILQVANQAL